MTPRTIFIWDVHGCIDELRELMEKLAPRPEDRVIFLGDLINKGPDSIGVVRYVYEHGYECVLGNHELSYIDHHATAPRYQQYYSQFSPEIHDWLLNLPHYIEGEDFIAVHGGVVPGLHPKDTDKGITCEIRYWNTENTCMGNKEHTPWHELYAGVKKVIYGYWAVQWLMVRENTIGLDSRCVYGGELSAYVLENAEISQVQAKQVYEEPKIK